MKRLDDNIATLREASRKYQEQLIKQRAAADTVTTPNHYKPGEFVLLQTQGHRATKLTPRYRGPYEVIIQRKNDIECRHLAMGNIQVLHVQRVQLFIGSREEALAAATWDADQYQVTAITAYRSDPNKRSTLEFLVTFMDGDELWVGYSTAGNNISKTDTFERYCQSKPELQIVLLQQRDVPRFISARNKRRITTLDIGDVFYLDLRTYGHDWYALLALPQCDTLTYVTQCRAIAWVTAGYKMEMRDETLDVTFFYRTHEVLSYAYRRTLSDKEVLITSDMLVEYPAILSRELTK